MNHKHFSLSNELVFNKGQIEKKKKKEGHRCSVLGDSCLANGLKFCPNLALAIEWNDEY